MADRETVNDGLRSRSLRGDGALYDRHRHPALSGASMFRDIHLQEPQVLPLNGEKFRRVVEDRDRDCRLYGLGGYMYGSRRGHVLQAGDKYVPFDTYSEQYTDEDGEVRAIVYFYSFGRSELDEKRRIPDFEFGNEEEKDRLRRIAAEAVLVRATWPTPTSPEQVRISLGGSS